MHIILKNMNKEVKITFSIAGAVIVAVIALMILSPKSTVGPTVTNVDLVSTATHMTGLKNAKVTLVEFGDYECPACAAINPSLEALIASYKNNPNFNFVFRNYPLPQHNNAMIAAEAAEAAGAQGKFWEMKALLYERQGEWAESTTPIDSFIKYATELKLNTTQFKSAVENKKYENIITSDRSLGESIRVSWTPTFYINGELQEATGDMGIIKAKIDSLLKN